MTPKSSVPQAARSDSCVLMADRRCGQDLGPVAAKRAAPLHHFQYGIGARRRDIKRQFLIEAAVLALAGGLIGILVGSAAAATIALAAHWPVLISPSAAALAWAFAGVVGIAFGLYAAFRASRLDPIVALRFE